ncbi:MAG: type IV pilus assembly protein PilM [Planctomycetes bacterium]|nr:type IV pilus assembly protein PilM [Planctomycetota bacterium]
MLGSKVAWGIDIGESAVRAAKLKVDKNGAEVLSLDVIPRTSREEGYSYLGKEEQVREALCTFTGRNKIGSARVALSVPGAGFDKFISLPAVSMKQVPQIVKYEARQQIPFPLEEVAWAYQLASERPQIPGESIEVALFAIKNQIIEQLLAGLSVAKLGVDIIGMGRLALYNFLKYDRRIDDGTIIVDVGAGSTDVVILAEGNFRVRSIPISGEAVTKMLQQKFGIAYEEAEELKKKASGSKQPEKLFNVMRPTFERLLGEIHKTIGYYKQQFKSLKIQEAFLLGESFKMTPLVELFGRSLGCKVNVMSHFERVSIGEAAAAGPHVGNLSSFTVAMGLALQAAGEGPITINVLPDEMKVQRELGRKKPFAIAAVACLGIGVLASLLQVSADESRLAALGEKPESKVREYKALASDYTMATDTSFIDDRTAGLAPMGSDRDLPMLAINELSRIFGTESDPGVPFKPREKGIFLSNISMEARLDEYRSIRELTIEGRSEADREFIEQQLVDPLRGVEIFTIPEGGVKWRDIEPEGGGKLIREFTIIIEVGRRPAGEKEAEDL